MKKLPPGLFLRGLGLKFIFHWQVQQLIFRKLLLSSFTEVFFSCTTENRGVSSANNAGLEDKSFDRSLIYIYISIYICIKKNCGPRIDAWGIPARTLVQNGVWPLRTTLCLRFFRKKFIKRRVFSEIPYWFNLGIRPSCHTLQKALDILFIYLFISVF